MKLGIKRLRITAYHPVSNELIKRFYKQLKSAFKAHYTLSWYEVLQIILLGIYSTLKADAQVFWSVWFTALHFKYLVSFFFSNVENRDKCKYVKLLFGRIKKLHSIPTRAQTRKTHVPQNLDSCIYVFVRINSAQKPLEQPY